MNPFKFLLNAVSILVLLVVSGCSDDKDSLTNSTPTTSKVRVIHSSYDAPAVDIRVDGQVAISNLAFGESSGYADVPTGTRNIQVTPTGVSTPVVIEANLPIEANKEYSVIAVGDLASITPIVVEDNRSSNSSKAKIRFLHASPDAPAVDIKLNGGTGPAVFSNQAFKDITPYTEVDAGSYTFVVTPSGSSDEVFVFNPITVENGKVYTVIAQGTLSNTDNITFTARVFVDNNDGKASVDLVAAIANVLVVHASPDAPGVDLLVDGIVVNSQALDFPDNTGYLPINAGTRNVKVNPSGSAASVIDANLTLEANKNYSVFAVDIVTNITPLVLEDDLTAPASGKSHVRFIHLSPDAPAVDITLTDGTVVFGNKTFKEFTDFTPLDAGSYNLQVRAAGTATVVLNLPTITLQDGKIYTVFAKGFLSGGTQPLGAEIILKN
jgi:hypothetical protein